ncbi:MAG: extracellular solute-binding protein [Ilumatobacter sp.]|uniref:extracellular solute-binding protein n=1 Tax=Ilumatobacter sp. TaxID=1967498 RepID=UPI0026118E02|nr:extracellular solute-binding protein [Ilumatobacter sp.]MDJ0768300.1 extracellular solute-binding protein [Ilumatobacter sp.]
MAFAVSAAVVFAACGGDDEDDADDADESVADEAADDEPAADEPAADEPAADEPAADEPAAGDDIVIPVWIAFEDYRLDWTNDVAAAFNEQVDGYTVEITGFASYNDAFEAAIQAINTGEPPGVVHFFEAATQEARDAISNDGEPVFADLEEIIAGRTEVAGVPVVLDDVVASAATYYQLDGSYTSMPWNTSSAIMFLNRTLLDAAGVEGTPTTWQELEAACAAFMASDAATDSCVTWPNHSWFVEQDMALQGALLANNDNGRSDRADEVFIDSDAMVDYVTWWKGMADQGYYTYTGTQRDWGGTYDLFAAQNVPFLLYSSSDTTALTDEGVNGGFDVEAAFLPRNAEATGGGALIGGATNWVINGLDETTQDGAIAWVNFVSNPENAASWHQTTGYIPITEGAISALEAEGWYEANPNQRIASEQLAASPDTPATTGALIGNFVAIRDVITEAIESVLVNGDDPAERLASAQEDAQMLLDEYNLLFGDG